MKTALTALVVAFMLLLTFNLTSAHSAFTATVRNSTNTVGTGTTFLQATKTGTTQCASTPTGATIPDQDHFNCAGTQLPVSTPTSGSASSATTLTASGTLNFGTVNHDALACGAVSNLNSIASTNPMLVRGGVTYQTGTVTGLPGSESMGFNGTNAYSVSVTQEAPLQNFTIGVWMKSTVRSGGIVSFTNSPGNTTASTFDRHLYLDGAGRIVFGTNNNGTERVVTTPAMYADGSWHFVTAVAQSNTGNGGQTNRTRLTLYVDGVQRVTNVFNGATAASTVPGYWRVGQARGLTTDGYTGTGSQFFTGSLANFTVIPSALTATQVTAWDNTASQSSQQAYATSIAGADNFWALGDTGEDLFTGPYPAGAANPCGHIAVTVATTNPARCLYPVRTTACPALSATSTLQTLANAPATPMTIPTPGLPQTVTTSIARTSGYNTGYNPGLHLLVPTRITTTSFDQTFLWAANEVII